MTRKRKFEPGIERGPVHAAVIVRKPDIAGTSTIEIRQRAGNMGLQRLFETPLRLQLQPDPNAPAPATATAPASAPPDPIDALIDAIAVTIDEPLSAITLAPPKDPKRALTPKLVLKQQWPPIRRWIIELGTKKATRVPTAFAALDTPDITEAILPLSRADRGRLADGVLDRLIPSVGDEAPETYREEFARLDKNARHALEPSTDPIVGYVAMRDGLKDTFGSIGAMNAYFGTLVPADFPPGTTNVFGRDSLVHPDLKAALQKAAAYLKSDKVPKGTFDRVVASLADVATLSGKVNHRGSWAISIRENRNRPTEIGNHSFGFALDIDSKANPNLPDFRWDIVKELTGFDVYGPDIAGAKAGQPYATALQSAKRFRAASDLFRTKFDSQAHFEATLVTEAAKHRIRLAPAELFPAVAAAAQHGKPGVEGLATLKRLLLDALEKEEARTAVRDSSAGEGSYSASEDPLVLYTLVSALRPKIRSRADLARLMPYVIAQVTNPVDTPAFTKTAELAILFDRKVIAELKRVPENVRRYELPNSLLQRLSPPAKQAEVATLAASLVELHGIFVGTRDKRGQPIGEGTSLPAVAMHGFMNLEPELVAALTSSEGGNLVWLGATYYTKDWMHFQLKSPPNITPQGTWP